MRGKKVVFISIMVAAQINEGGFNGAGLHSLSKQKSKDGGHAAQGGFEEGVHEFILR
jgi:hypothetical protein